MTDVSRRFASGPAMVRAMASLLAPGENGTTMRTSFGAASCAAAVGALATFYQQPETEQNVREAVVRLIAKMPTTTTNYVMIGHSNGGIVSRRVAQLAASSGVRCG